jgi:hypothetical protein
LRPGNRDFCTRFLSDCVKSRPAVPCVKMKAILRAADIDVDDIRQLMSQNSVETEERARFTLSAMASVRRRRRPQGARW